MSAHHLVYFWMVSVSGIGSTGWAIAILRITKVSSKIINHWGSKGRFASNGPHFVCIIVINLVRNLLNRICYLVRTDFNQELVAKKAFLFEGIVLRCCNVLLKFFLRSSCDLFNVLATASFLLSSLFSFFSACCLAFSIVSNSMTAFRFMSSMVANRKFD